MTNIIKRVVSVIMATLFLLSFPVVALAQAPADIYMSILYDDGWIDSLQLQNSTSGSIVSQWDYNQLDSAYVYVSVPFDIKKGDNITIKIYVDNFSYYSTVSSYFLSASLNDHGDYYTPEVIDGNVTYTQGLIKCEFVSPANYSRSSYSVGLGVTLNCNSTSMDIVQFNVSNIDVSNNDADTNFMTDVRNWFQKLFNKIGDSASQVTASLKTQADNVKSAITGSLDSWGQSIVNWFSSIGTQLTDMKSSIKTWFNGLGDRIGGFFNSLFNKIWWGNEDGESSYQEPTFNSGVYDVLITLDTYYERLEDTKTQIDTSKEEISTYIEDGTSFLDDVIGVFPASVLALLSFSVVLLFVRKVVGR